MNLVVAVGFAWVLLAPLVALLIGRGLRYGDRRELTVWSPRFPISFRPTR
jgi:hypothetical protein